LVYFFYNLRRQQVIRQATFKCRSQLQSVSLSTVSENIKDAIEGYIHVLKKHGREDEIPKRAGEVESVEVAIA